MTQSQFPLENDTHDNFPGYNGFITDVEVDASTGLVYFDTYSQHPYNPLSPGATDYDPALNKIYYISENANAGTATALTLTGLPGGNHFYPTNMQFDAASRQLYVASEDTALGNDPGGNDVIYVFQLDTLGHSATLIRTIAYDNPAMTVDAASLGGMAFNNLAALAALSATTTHAVEQGSRVTLLTAAPTITDLDGDHLASATVRITGGTFSSGETSAADDHLSVNDQISGLISGTNITVAWNSATETLTLTGYDTLAHYQTVLSQVQYNATGQNPTNSGANTTRTISWQLNDGALGDPTGTANATTTNLRTTTLTIDAVDGPPLISSLGAFDGAGSATEDTGKQITFSLADADGGPATITVRLQVLHGTIDINTGVGGGVAAGGVTGDNTNDVLLTSTLSQINATLANLTGAVYRANADYNGADTLTVTSSSGGPQTDVATRTININAAADIVADSISTTEDNAVTANLITGTNGASADNFENAGRVISSVTQGAARRRDLPGRRQRDLYAGRQLQRLRQLHLHGDVGRGDRNRQRHRRRRGGERCSGPGRAGVARWPAQCRARHHRHHFRRCGWPGRQRNRDLHVHHRQFLRGQWRRRDRHRQQQPYAHAHRLDGEPDQFHRRQQADLLVAFKRNHSRHPERQRKHPGAGEELRQLRHRRRARHTVGGECDVGIGS